MTTLISTRLLLALAESKEEATHAHSCQRTNCNGTWECKGHDCNQTFLCDRCEEGWPW